MRRCITFLLLLGGCGHGVTSAVNTAHARAGAAEVQAIASADEYCELAQEDECSAMRDLAASLAEALNEAKTILSESVDEAAAIDRALETRKRR